MDHEKLKEYSIGVANQLHLALSAQKDSLIDVGLDLVNRVLHGHHVWAFGSGHSHILVEEWLDKPGSPQFIKTVGMEEVLGHPVKCGIIERDEAFGAVVMKMWSVKARDAVILISNSGTNGQIVELALQLKTKQCRVIALTNPTQSRAVSARHSSGKKLYQIADVVLDNYSGNGDAVFEVAKDQFMGATSTIIGSALIQALNVVMMTAMVQAEFHKSRRMKGKINDRLVTIDREGIRQSLDEFIHRLTKAIDDHCELTLPQIARAGQVAAQAVLDGHDCFMFGMGHDHSLVEEIHARAGTVMVNRSLVMHNPETMITNGQLKAKLYAGITSYGQAIYEMADPNPGDCFLVFSQQFHEPAIQQLCVLAARQGCPVIGVTRAQTKESSPLEGITWIKMRIPSRLHCGHSFVGDLTTVLGALTGQCLVMAQAMMLMDQGVVLPSRISVNTDRGLIHTEAMNRKHFKASIV